jgi:DNA (cytosine-5)-methyltransferase 1
MRVVEETQPRAFVLENVTGLAYAGKDEGLQHLLEEIAAINRRAKTNYRPFFRVLKAAEFGVPQLRERFFLVAARDGAEFEFPAQQFTDFSSVVDGVLFEPPLPHYRTAWDAIGA